MLWLEYRPTINWFIGAIALEWTASLKVEVRENLNFFRLIHFIAAKRTLTYCIAAIKWFHRNKWQIQERPVLADIWDVSYKVIVLVIRDALSCIRKNKSYNFLTQWTDKGAKKSIKTTDGLTLCSIKRSLILISTSKLVQIICGMPEMWWLKKSADIFIYFLNLYLHSFMF